ncbi:MAG: hypothetical protein WBQ86_16405, partial [Candidatus Binatus sp.]
MQMLPLRMIAAAVVALVVSGCGKSNPPSNQSSNPSANQSANQTSNLVPNPPPSSLASNPLIGRWKLADQSENN